MIQCPDCGTEFEETPPWDSGHCPKCEKRYIWDEMMVQEDDYTDSYPTVDWRTWDEL